MMGSLSSGRSLLLGAMLLPALVAQESAITREGRYWVQSIQGSGAIAQPRLQVKTNGDVTVAGSSKSGYTYTLKLRVRAANERQARTRLAATQVSAAAHGDIFVLSAPVSDSASELRVEVPRSVKEVTIATAGGGVDLSDLNGLLRAETGGGGVRCDRIAGSLAVATAGGGISLGAIEGMVQCITAGGGISANVIRGEAVFETGGGDIVVQEVTGLVRASTGGGGIKIVRAGSAVIASTAGGPIQVERAAGQVTVKSSAGSHPGELRQQRAVRERGRRHSVAQHLRQPARIHRWWAISARRCWPTSRSRIRFSPRVPVTLRYSSRLISG